MDSLIGLLKKHAHLSNAELAVMLGTTEEDVEKRIQDLEDREIIKGYSAILDYYALDPNLVTAFIELNVTPQSQSGFDDIADSICKYDQVESVRLMSGGYDILVEVTGVSIRDVSLFVSQNLATIDAVQSTTTHFVLKNYMDNGILVSGHEEKDERGLVSP
ncbi:MAG: Lrp/AsnC family transcriptional regulator [Oscillospiraceae bacterium]